jgi:hypothetical protein
LWPVYVPGNYYGYGGYGYGGFGYGYPYYGYYGYYPYYWGGTIGHTGIRAVLSTVKISVK